MIAATVLALALAAGPETAPALEKVTFQEAVRRALARNTSSVVAAEDVRRTEGILGQVRSNALPFLGAAGTLTWLDHDRTSGSTVISAERQANGTGLLSVPLVAPSRWAQWAHASQAVDASQANDADVRRSVAVSAARTYLTVIALRRAVAVSETARDTAKAHYDYAHARRVGGVGNALDELRADQELAASEVQLQTAYIGLARGREALGQTAGEDRPLDAADEPGLPELPSEAQALSESDLLRADVKAAQARSYVALRTSKDSWTDWMPTIFGTFQGWIQDPPSLQFPRQGWQAQLILSFPLFEGGLRPAQALERDALAREAEAQLDGIVRQAHSDVRTAFDSLKRARVALDAARRGSDSARSALDLASKAYRAGAVDNLAVTDAEQRSRTTDVAAVIAEDAVRQALLDLLAAAGRFP
jgi:outer membrane protein TolC